MKTLKDLILKMCKLDYISIADVVFLIQWWCPVSEWYPHRLSYLKEYREDELSDEDEYLCKFSMNIVTSPTFVTSLW